MKAKNITAAEMERDRVLFQRLKRRISFDEKLLLMTFVADYPGYQKTLQQLAARHGIEVPPVV